MLSWDLLSSSVLSSCCHCLEVGWPAGLLGDFYPQKKMTCLWERSVAHYCFTRCSNWQYSEAQNQELELGSADSPIHSHPNMPLHQSFFLTHAVAFCKKDFILNWCCRLCIKSSILDWCCCLCIKSFLGAQKGCSSSVSNASLGAHQWSVLQPPRWPYCIFTSFCLLDLSPTWKCCSLLIR